MIQHGMINVKVFVDYIYSKAIEIPMDAIPNGAQLYQKFLDGDIVTDESGGGGGGDDDGEFKFAQRRYWGW